MKERYFVILKVEHRGKEAVIFFIDNNPNKLAKDLYTHIATKGSFIYQSKIMGKRAYGEKDKFHEVFKSLGDVMWYRMDRVQFIKYEIRKLQCQVYRGIGLSIKDEKKFLKLFKEAN